MEAKTLQRNDVPVDLHSEILYSEGVKSLAGGVAQGLVYSEQYPISGSSYTEGQSIIFNLANSTAMWDTSRSEVLFSITPTFTGGGLIYPETSAGMFKQIIVRSNSSGQTLCSVNHYGKLNNMLRAIKQANVGSLGKEGAPSFNGMAIGQTSAVTATFVSGLLIADSAYAEKTNTHRQISSGQTVNLSLALRGLGLASLTSSENGLFVPLALMGQTGLQIELQLVDNFAEAFFGKGVTTNGAVTAQLANVRMKTAYIHYQPSFIMELKEKVRQAGSLPISVPRFYVTSNATTSTSIAQQIGLVAKSVRSVIVFNDLVSQGNNASFCHLSTSPNMSATNFFTQLDGENFPSKPLTSNLQYLAYGEEALGGIGNNFAVQKYISTETDAADLINGSADFSNLPSMFFLGIDYESAPKVSNIMTGKNTGVNLIVNIERTTSDNRNFYYAVYYDTIINIMPDGTVIETQ